jgi:LacI family transcriptional regulator
MKRTTKAKLPTMYDVARLAGVSQPTVSRVLNSNETTVQISNETRQRVLDAVSQLGYRPNVVARGLRTQRTQTVALLIADLANAFYHPLARSVQDVARQHDYEVLISNSDHLYENEIHFCEIVSRRLVDGVIMVPIHITAEDIEHYFGSTHTPITVLGGQIKHPDIDEVFADDEQATYEAVRWMIDERGYRNIGFIGVSEDLPPGPRRFHGFMRALNEGGLTLDPRFVLKGDFTMESGVAAAKELLKVGELPRALFVLNDLMAIGVILTLQEAGVAVPRDVAVMGFDDIPEAQIVRPALTTIAQDPRFIGQKLAESLFNRIQNPDQESRQIFEAECKLVVRDSA